MKDRDDRAKRQISNQLTQVLQSIYRLSGTIADEIVITPVMNENELLDYRVVTELRRECEQDN